MSPLAATTGADGSTSFGAFWAIAFVFLLGRELKRWNAPGVNRKGVVAAVLVYAAALALNVLQPLKGAKLVPPVAWIAVTILGGVAVVVAVVLATQALLETRAARRAGQAVSASDAGWALGLAVFFLLSMGVGVVAGLARRDALPDELVKRVDGPVRNEELNFAFRPPPGYVGLDPKKLNPLAAVGYGRSRPQVFFTLIGEAGVELDSDEVAEVSETNLRAGAKTATVLERGPLTVNGLQGVRIVSRAQVGALDLAYVHWVYAGNGYVYQLITWGAAKDTEAVKREASALVRGFSLLDPARRPAAPAPPPPERRWSFRSPAWGYRADLDRELFSEWTALAKEMPKADFGARCGEACAIAVFPLRRPEPGPGLDAVARALLDMVDLEYPGGEYTDRREVRVGVAEGFEVSLRTEEEDSSWSWRLRVLAHGDRAWLVAGFSPAKDAELARKRDLGVEAVRFEPPEGEVPRPTTRRDLLRQSRALNEMGLYEYELEQYASAAGLFAEAARLSPDDRVLLQNAAGAHADAGLFEEGLALLDAGRGRFPGDAKLEAIRAQLASHAGREEEARRAYAKLFARGFQSSEHLRRYAELLEQAGRRKEAVALVARQRRRRDDRDATLLHAELLQRAGSRRQAVKVLRDAFSRRPDVGVGWELVDALLEGGGAADALREARRVVARFPGSAAAAVQQGRCELALGRHEAAKRSFEAATRSDPTDARARDYLEHVSGLLGEGQNSSLKEPIAEVELPPGVLDPAPARAPPEGHGAWFVERRVAIAFRKGEELRRTDLWRGKAVDAAGVERLGTFELEFDPLAERIFVNRVVVRDAAGKEVARGRPADWYVSDEATASLGTHRRRLHVQVPALRPGHEVEVVVTRRDAGPPDRMEFLELSLAASLPRLRSAVVLVGDVDAVAAVSSPGVTERRVPGAVAFVAEGDALFRPEPMRADHQEWLPTVWIGPAGGSWAREAEDYQKEIAAVDVPDAAVAALAAEKARGAATPAAKVAALGRWVQKELTYRAIEFGRRAHVPHRLPEILAGRFGDCKDHALLLKRLLEAQGVDARLALVRADGPVRPELPSVDQFDHMVVWVPGADGGTFVDPTEKGAAPGAGTPRGLGGAKALVLDGARSRLVELPAEGGTRVSSTRAVALSGQDLDVRETLEIDGPGGAGMRSYLTGIAPADRVAAVQSLLEGSGDGVRVTSVKVNRADEPEKPLGLELRYHLRARRAGAAGALTLPAVWERYYLSAEPVEARRSPFDVEALEFRSQVELSAPDAELSVPPAPPAGQGSFARWSQATSGGGASVRLEATLERARGRYEPGRWEAFREEMDRALGGVEAAVAIARAGPRGYAPGGR